MKKNKYIFIAFILAMIFSTIFHSYFTFIHVEGSSMAPTLKDSTYGISLNTNHFSAIERFDIVIVKSDATGGNTWIKRVIGMPGDTIEMKNEVVYLNGHKLNEEYVMSYDGVDTSGMLNLMDDFKYTLGDDQYFLMGDNRKNSYDSRVVGFFQKKDMIATHFYTWNGER